MALTIEDRLDLMLMPGRYGNAIDDRDWVALRAMMTDDCVFDCSTAFDVVMNGADEVVDFMDKTDYHPLGHMMTNVDITEADGKVLVRFRSIFPIRNEDGSLMPSVVRHGCYYDEVVKTPTGWKLKHRTFTRRPKDLKPTATDLAIEARFQKA